MYRLSERKGNVKHMNKGKAFGNKKSENNRPAIRKGDNYSTHYSLTELLFENAKDNIGIEFDFTKPVLEPAAGEGAMVKVLSEYFDNVYGYDPVYGFSLTGGGKNEGVLLENYSFLTHDFNPFDYIITNPPFSLADKFVLRAKELEPEMFCFFLRTNYLSGQARLKKKIYEGLAHVSVFDRMPDLRAPIRLDGRFPTAMIVYACFTWIKGYKGKPTFESLKCSNYVLHKKDIKGV
jgi:hypothetical protein